MIRRIVVCLLVLVTAQSEASDKIKFDGICRVTSSNGKQWCGVAVSDSQVVSVWHPQEFGELYVEFSESHHGHKTRLKLNGIVTRANRYADLSIIQFKSPEYVELRSYKLGKRKTDHVRIAGFVRDSPEIIENAITVKYKFRDADGTTKMLEEIVDSGGYVLDQFDKPGKPGMSGSPAFEGDTVVGIQTAGTRRVLTVPGDTVQRFLNGEIRDER